MDETMEDTSGQRVTLKQREVMVLYMQENSALATGRFATADGAKHRAKLMKDMSDKLNAVANGATKSPEKWMKCWQDWKSDIKKKASKIKRHANGTGGGPPSRTQLTQLEQDVIALMGPVAVSGQETTDPLDAQMRVLGDLPLRNTEPEGASGSVASSSGIVLQAIPFSTWMQGEVAPVNPVISHLTIPLPEPSPTSSESSYLPTSNSEAEEIVQQRKRKKSEGGTSLTRSQESLSRNADSLACQASAQQGRLKLEIERFEQEVIWKQRELETAERMADAAVQTASAMQSMAMAVSEAMQAFQTYLQNK